MLVKDSHCIIMRIYYYHTFIVPVSPRGLLQIYNCLGGLTSPYSHSTLLVNQFHIHLIVLWLRVFIFPHSAWDLRAEIICTLLFCDSSSPSWGKTHCLWNLGSVISQLCELVRVISLLWTSVL